MKHGNDGKSEMPPKQVKPPKPTKTTKPLKGGRIVKGVPYKVSEVVRACFPEVFGKGLVTAEDIVFLQTEESSKRFRTGGNPVIKLDRGIDTDRIRVASSGFKKARFYPSSKVSLGFAGKKYYLSREFAPEALNLVVTWLEGKGFSKADIAELTQRAISAKGGNAGPDLFDNIS